MRFFYTGAKEIGLAQTSQELSLGGIVSTSVVPNGQKNNLFSGISQKMILDGDEEVRGIVLKNETGATVYDIELYIEQITDVCSFELAAVTIVNDAMELLSSPRSLPYVGTFVEATGFGDRVMVTGVLPDDGMIGLWVKRITHKQVFDETDLCSMVPFSESVTSPQIVVLYETEQPALSCDTLNDEWLAEVDVIVDYKLNGDTMVVFTQMHPDGSPYHKNLTPVAGIFNFKFGNIETNPAFLFFTNRGINVLGVTIEVFHQSGSAVELRSYAQLVADFGLVDVGRPTFVMEGAYTVIVSFQTDECEVPMKAQMVINIDLP